MPPPIDAKRPFAPHAAFGTLRDSILSGIEANARGMLSSSDPEFLHQLRVGQRRLRAALRVFRKLLPRRRYKRVVAALRKLSPVFGAARDWDVLSMRTMPDQKARRRAAQARAAAMHAVRSKRFDRMIDEARRLEAHPTAQPLDRFAAARLERARRKLAKDIDWSDAAERHALRIRVKRLRYTCEFFAPVSSPRATRGYVEALKQLQDILGELNDIAVGRRLIGYETDEAPLLRRLAPAWRALERRPVFWRVPA